jgi:hypothetical protein
MCARIYFVELKYSQLKIIHLNDTPSIKAVGGGIYSGVFDKDVKVPAKVMRQSLLIPLLPTGATSQSADKADADADADKDVDVVLESLCFACPPTIVIEQCKLNLIVGVLILKKNKELCSLSLVDTAILDQCANGLP